jgi:hypothetical protein
MFVIGVLALPVVAPIALGLALLIERPTEQVDAGSAGRLGSDEAAIGLPAGAD